MGNDGGSIPTRRELVKEAARNPTAAQIKESQHEQQDYYWTTDPISQKPLARPIVSDSSGKLFNKETILEYLVEGKRKEDAESVTEGRVKSLKDVVEVKFEVGPESAEKTSPSGPAEVWRCPVTGDRFGPGSKAVYLVPCGHAFAGSAIKEVSGERCMVCETEYASNDIIPIISMEALDIARLTLRAKTLHEQGLTHSLKKASGSKKRKKRDATGGANTNDAAIAVDPSETAGGLRNASTASLTAKVLQEQEQNKKRRMANENVRSLFSSKDSDQSIGKKNDFMTRGYSVPQSTKR